MNQAIELLKSYRFMRKFTDQFVPLEILQEIQIAGQATATSIFVQATTVVRVTGRYRNPAAYALIS